LIAFGECKIVEPVTGSIPPATNMPCISGGSYVAWNCRIKPTHPGKMPNHLEKVLHKLVKRFPMIDLKPLLSIGLRMVSGSSEI